MDNFELEASTCPCSDSHTEPEAQPLANAESYLAPEATLVQVVPETVQLPREEIAAPCKPTGKGRRWWKRAICLVVALGVVIGCCLGTAMCLNTYWQRKFNRQAKQQQQMISELQDQLNQRPAVQNPVVKEENVTVVLPDGVPVEGDLTPAQVYAMNVNAVVAISNQGLTTNIFGQVSQTASSGSGFIISADGYVVSNYHVIQGANTLTVITSDGIEHDAKVVGYDATNDLSVLKIEGNDFDYAHIGSSDELVVGAQVVAIGNPLGELTSTLTVGYVSAKDRLVNTDGTSMNMLQTDAAINSGNSGGPLFNMRGEVIGITTAKYSGTSTSGASIEGIGFAIPMDDVKDLVEDLIQYGYVKTGYMGVTVQDVPAEDAKKYALPMGALILDVVPGNCADRAGLKSGDIIVAVDENPVRSVTDLTRVLRMYEPGMEAQITVYRSGAEQTFQAVFDEKPQTTSVQIPQEEESDSAVPGFDMWPFLP